MARTESEALGGFYATPPELVPAIAALCSRGHGATFSLLDPCAADGEAALAFARLVFGGVWDRFSLYACELEAARAAKLRARAGEKRDFERHRLHALHGDAFAVEWTFEPDKHAWGRAHGGASVLFANPPYHLGTLEARFLDRFTEALRPGAVLIYLVPYYALAKSAATLAKHYDVAACYRFPEPLFSEDPHRGFKQVALYAVRRQSLLEPDRRAVARINGWAADAATIPVLPAAGTAAPIATIEGHDNTGYETWRMRPVDVDGLLARFQPLHYTDRGGATQPIPGIVPPADARELLCRRYPVATPLKPAHIATAIAAGVFNGARIAADDPASGWPELLVKGVFDREFAEIDEKTNKDGEKTGSIKVQQPRLRVTVLDLSTRRYHTLVDSDEETDAATVDRLTTADLLAIYGRDLLRVMLENCPPLHDPQRPDHAVPLAEVTRPLYRAQAHTVQAAVKLLGGVELPAGPHRRRGRWKAAAWRRLRRGKAAILLGEVGAGKTACALATAKTLALPVLASGGTYRVLVFCPPHLLKSWSDQAAAVVPEARVHVLRDVADVDALAADTAPGLVLGILSREAAKLGHAWDGVGHERCLLRVDGSCGFVTGPAHRARRGMTLRLRVRDIAPDTESVVAVEQTRDGRTWTHLATFDPAETCGEQRLDVDVATGSRHVRVVWSASGPAAFEVIDDAYAESRCPRCGEPTPRPEKAGSNHRDELARKRVTCAAERRVPLDPIAVSACDVALALYPAYPHAADVRQLLSGPHQRALVERLAARVPDPDAMRHAPPAEVEAGREAVNVAWAAVRSRPELRRALETTVRVRCRRGGDGRRDALDKAIQGLAWAIGDDELTARMAVELYTCKAAMADAGMWSAGGHLRDLARGLLLTLPDGDHYREAEAVMKATGMLDVPTYPGGGPAPWAKLAEDRRAIAAGNRAAGWQDGIKAENGTVTHDGHARRDGAAAVAALAALTACGTWRTLPPCGEPLYAATADPQRGGRRVALAKYIVRHYRRFFDLLVIDEVHETASDSSAQAAAAYRLAAMGVPVIAMTGTAMGGYAEQLFNQQLALDPMFREEFARDQRRAFVDRYGYVKVLEQDIRKDDGKVVAYGSVSDRVERQTRILGNAPGVLPLFLLRYLLRIAPVLHKADLALDLPPCREIPVEVDPGAELTTRYKEAHDKLTAQIKRDRFDRMLAGKLWGALAHFVDYPDLATADTGNAAGGVYEIRYPKNRDLGTKAGEVVHRVDPFPRSTVMPKEQWMLDTVRAELEEGRRCMVLATAAVLLPRLRRLLAEALGEPVALLDAKKVDTAHREAWINAEVVDRGVRILVVNPEAIQTGLNPLVWFSTEIWMQNPGCKALVRRQAIGRVDRIGQRAAETRIYTAHYKLPACEAADALWMHKTAVSLATDGLDAGAALAAAGVGGEEGRFDGFSVGKLIFDLMTGERSFASRRHVAAAA